MTQLFDFSTFRAIFISPRHRRHHGSARRRRHTAVISDALRERILYIIEAFEAISRFSDKADIILIIKKSR